MDARCRIELLGGLRLVRGEQVITRFRTHASAAVLARLAFSLLPQSREALIEKVWPDADPRTGGVRLSTAMSSLRHQLEPPGVQYGSVLLANRLTVQLNPEAVVTDVAAFERALQDGRDAKTPTDEEAALLRAIGLYRGVLLPEFYQDWILPEQEHLASRYGFACLRLSAICEAQGDQVGAMEHARSAIASDPFDEESHRCLMRLLAQGGHVVEARRLYRNLVRRLREKLGEKVSEPTRLLARRLRQVAEEGHAQAAVSPVPAVLEPDSATQLESVPSPKPTRVDSRLPVQMTRFFGREEEIERIEDMCRPSSAGEEPPDRLLTLLGMGGSGKTRLAIAAAVRLVLPYEGRVWFVPLADVREARLIGDALLSALEVERSAHREPLDQAMDYLDSQSPNRCLLILDNCEHLVDGGAEIILSLLSRAPSVQILATSRRLLGLQAEREFQVGPLPAPAAGDSLSEVAKSPAVRLFVDRAQRVRPDFQLTERNAAAICGLCQSLEGIPLAIELAAGRAQVMTAQQMVAQLDHRFDLLSTHRRDAIDRHRSLRAALGWSFGLLSPELQRLFARLSVFRGGWTAEAVEAVCLPLSANWSDEAGEIYLPDSLSHLAEASLILVEESGEQNRFRMLETLREFAAEKLPSDERDELSRRHADFFVKVAEEASLNLEGPRQAEWMDRLADDYDNLRAAMERPLDVQIGLRIGGALWRFWMTRGLLSEGRHQLSRLLALPSAAPRTTYRATALYCNGVLAAIMNDHEQSVAQLEESLQISRELNDARGAASTLNSLAVSDLNRGRFAEARKLFAEVVVLAGDADAHFLAATARANLGMVLWNQGEYAEARSVFEECLAFHRTTDSLVGMSQVLNNLGGLSIDQGDYSAARPYCEEALSLNRRLGYRHWEAINLGNLGNAALGLGDYDAAVAYQEQSLHIHQDIGSRNGLAVNCVDLGRIAEARGDLTTALSHLRAGLGIASEVAEPSAIVDAMEGLAQVAAAHDHVQAVRHWGFVERIREEIKAPLAASRRERASLSIDIVHAALGDAAFFRAWQEGREMTMEQAVAYALGKSA